MLFLMIKFYRIFLIVLLVSTSLTRGTAQEIHADLSTEEDLFEKAKLKKEMVQSLFIEARQLMSFSYYDKALTKLNTALELAPEEHALWNLKGAIEVQNRNFDAAKKSFKTSLKYKLHAWDVHFNLAELEFVQKNFQESKKQFSKLLDDNEEMPVIQKDVCKFKVFLCHYLLEQKEEAFEIIKEVSYLGNSPAYFYMKAVKDYDLGKKIKAKGWIKSAYKIFENQQNQIFLDSFNELGWNERYKFYDGIDIQFPENNVGRPKTLGDD